jgi:hypothetical protein
MASGYGLNGGEYDYMHRNLTHILNWDYHNNRADPILSLYRPVPLLSFLAGAPLVLRCQQL